MFVQSSAIEYMTGELLARICDVLEMQINFTLFQHEYLYKFQLNRTGGVIVRVLASSAVISCVRVPVGSTQRL
jgi:hypothetical protein